MTGAGVLLDDVAATELGLEGVLASLASVAGQSDGVDHPVVSQGGGRDAVQGSGFPEGALDDRGGDRRVGAEVQGVAGAVVEPGDDLDVAAG